MFYIYFKIGNRRKTETAKSKREANGYMARVLRE